MSKFPEPTFSDLLLKIGAQFPNHILFRSIIVPSSYFKGKQSKIKVVGCVTMFGRSELPIEECKKIY